MARPEIDVIDPIQLLNHLNAAREELNVAREELNELLAQRKRIVDEIKELTKSHPIDLKDEKYLDYSLVITALKHGDNDLIKYLIDKGYRVYMNSKPNNVKTVLHAAIALNNADLIKTLLAKGAFPDILALDEQGKTPFHLAIDKNQLSTIDLFLSYFDAKTLDEKYLLHYAVETPYVQVVHLLIQHGLSSRKKNQKKLTPFCIALKSGHLEVIDCLLSYYKVQNIKPNDHDDIAQVYVAILRGNLTVIRKYADSGFSMNMPLKLDANTWPCLYEYTGFTLLHFAVTHVKLEIVRFLLRKGVDILVKNRNGSPLHIAFETKEKGIWKTWQDFDDNNSIIDLLLKVNMKFNSNLVNKYGLSHFHIACSRDDPIIVEHFLKIGALINRQVKSQCHLYKRFSALHFAAKFRCKNTMEVLLKNGADVKQRDFQKMTALHIAAKEACLETVSSLLAYGAKINIVDSHGKTPVHWAFENKNYKILDLLLSVPNVANSNPTNNEGISHFHISCTRSNVNIVKSFIENGVDLDSCVPTQSNTDNSSDITDCSGYSPLHFAVSHNRAKVVQLLLRSGANVAIKSSRGFTPFHLACQYTGDMFGDFIENTLCNLSKHGKITQQQQPFTDVVSIKTNTKKFSGSMGKLDWSAHRKDYLKIINVLLEYETDLNCTDTIGNSPILYAYVAVTKAQNILENNLDCSKDLHDEIVKSFSQELYERRKLILDHLMSFDVNLDKYFQLGSILNCISINFKKDNENAEIMKLFLEKGAKVNVRNNEMLTPLLQAVIDGREMLVSMLLEYGADVDSVDPRDNSTPLMLAISRSQYYSHDGVIRTLLREGANINARKSNGFTALHVACAKTHGFAVKWSLECAADINIDDNAGRSACCYLYERYLKYAPESQGSTFAMWLMQVFQQHIVKMKAIGLPISKKVLSTNSKFGQVRPLDEQEKKELVEKYQSEVQVLRDTKINDNYTLHDVVFKDENSLSQLVKNPAFDTVVRCESFKMKYINYGYLIKLKYEAGVNRGKLLPKAKILINQLAGMYLPDICAENIYKYFDNFELNTSLKILSGILNSNVASYEDVQLISHQRHKRQRID